jgi:hypothetical protein
MVGPLRAYTAFYQVFCHSQQIYEPVQVRLSTAGSANIVTRLHSDLKWNVYYQDKDILLDQLRKHGAPHATALDLGRMRVMNVWRLWPGSSNSQPLVLFDIDKQDSWGLDFRGAWAASKLDKVAQGHYWHDMDDQCALVFEQFCGSALPDGSHKTHQDPRMLMARKPVLHQAVVPLAVGSLSLRPSDELSPPPAGSCRIDH